MLPLARLVAPLAFVLAAGCSSSSSSSTPSDAGAPPGPLVIQTDLGGVQGKLVEDARAFLGIPYAAPPVGDLRWKPPAAAASWSATRDATAYGHDCPQYDIVSGAPLKDVVEDCLFLNVWTPIAAPSAPLPVMVFIHGGGFVLGSGSGATYEGSHLAASGVVAVTINYRLGPLGFLGHSALGNGGAPPPFGLLDQRAALQWVKRNIGAFGGDPSNVTIFGESAGGTSVCTQLVMPGSRGLFAKAIVESGPCGREAFFTPTQAQGYADDFAKALGCTDAATVAACMRGKSAADVLGALPLRKALFGRDGYLWQPVVDGTELPIAANPGLDAGMGAPVPLVIGTNKDEGNLFFEKLWNLAFNRDITEDDLTGLLPILFTPAQITQILARYPLASFSGPPAQASAMLTDGIFVCAARHSARASSARAPTYLYQFDYDLVTPLYGDIGVAHGLELPFVFHTNIGGKNIGDDQESLSRAMMGYWTRFAKTGDPNGAGAVTWPKYDAGDANIVFADAITTSMGLKKAECDFWDGL